MSHSTIINRVCKACRYESSIVGTATCTDDNIVTTWTCTRCKHPEWSCETDQAAPCRHHFH